MSRRRLSRIGFAILVSAAVALAARHAARLVALSPESFFPSSFVTHTVMLLLSLVLMWVLSKGRLGLYGFARGTYRFSPRILLWILPMGVLSGIAAFASPSGEPPGALGRLTKLQCVAFVWLYASVAEEILTRGLLQTLLSGAGRSGGSRSKFSLPVVLSALFFGAMHLVLLNLMGAIAVPAIVLAVLLGLVAGRYREATGSLIPAVIVHMLFNMGGMLPAWLIQFLRS